MSPAGSTTSCFAAMAVRHIFFAKADRDYLHELLAEASERFGTRVPGFCLMRNHMHPVNPAANSLRMTIR